MHVLSKIGTYWHLPIIYWHESCLCHVWMSTTAARGEVSWRNGSASDSRSEGWAFDPLRGHAFLAPHFLLPPTPRNFAPAAPIAQPPGALPGCAHFFCRPKICVSRWVPGGGACAPQPPGCGFCLPAVVTGRWAQLGWQLRQGEGAVAQAAAYGQVFLIVSATDLSEFNPHVSLTYVMACPEHPGWRPERFIAPRCAHK